MQGAGILATPLSSLGADVIAIGGHKGLFGLTGSGIVYCREELVDTTEDAFRQGAERDAPRASSAYANSQFDYTRVAHRFEGGNPNFLGVRVLEHGAKFLQSIGVPAIEARVRELTTTA